MSIRRNHKNAVKSNAKIARLREKSLKMLARVRASTMAMAERREARISWWQRAFRVPLVGFYGWVRSRCNTLWAACMTMLGMKPSKTTAVLAGRHGQIKNSKAQMRRLVHETMESRQLLAADVMVVATDTLAEEDPSAFNNQGQFTISLDSKHGTDVEVTYALSGDANSEFGTDYNAVSSSKTITKTGTLTIAAGQTSAVVDIDIVDDDLYDGPADEKVTLTITGNDSKLTMSKTVDSMTITDDDAAPTVSISATDASAAEPSDDGKFTVTQTGKSDTDTTVAISYTGTAHTSDYTAAASATISAGDTSEDVDVKVVDDTLIEGTESVIATLGAFSGPTNGGITIAGAKSDTVNIADTDDTGSVRIFEYDLKASETATDNAKISFTLWPGASSQSSTETVVEYAITGDAIEGTDYTLGNNPEYNSPNDTIGGPQGGSGPKALLAFRLHLMQISELGLPPFLT